jgi:phenylalanyl-tRNA synthetase alpha chain
MDQILNQIDQLKNEIASAKTDNAEALENFRTRFLGTKGLVKSLMGEMKNVPAEQRKEFGQVLNAFKLFAEEKYENLKAALGNGELKGGSDKDLSMPGDPFPAGSRHPVTLMRNRIVSIFQRLGFAVAEGPEIEDDWHNFTALNISENHPARDMQDTFYLSQNPDWLLRTHTSNVQIREMEKHKLPIRIICPGGFIVMKLSVPDRIVFFTRWRIIY